MPPPPPPPAQSSPQPWLKLGVFMTTKMMRKLKQIATIKHRPAHPALRLMMLQVLLLSHWRLRLTLWSLRQTMLTLLLLLLLMLQMLPVKGH
jgi:hypothetical protein